jgi:N6-adenine-specific methylase
MSNQNTLYTGDNLYILNGFDSESFDLIYLDPPFNKNRNFSAPVGSQAAGNSFKDMWTWEDVDKSYLNELVENYPHLVRFIESIGDYAFKSNESHMLLI